MRYYLPQLKYLIALVSIFFFPILVQAEGAFELRDGSAANLPIRIINAGGAPTYMRVDVLDPANEVIDIFTQNIGSPDIRVWCPGQIDVDAAAQGGIPAPDFTANVNNAAGRINNWTDVLNVQNIATRPRPPIAYNLSGPTATCGTAGTYTIRISNNAEYFDIAVRNTATNSLQRGRLFSYFWGFNGRTFNNFFRGKFYVVSGADFSTYYEGLVWEVDLNGIRPYVFEMLSNSVGVNPAIYNSKSVHASAVPKPVLVPEFPMYVNQPEKEIRGLPTIDTAKLDLDFDLDCDGDSQIKSLDFEFEVPGTFTYKIFVDENMDGSFDPAEQILAGNTLAGNNIVPWNAILPSGAQLTPGTNLDYKLDITGGEVHFPFRDVEYANPGPLINLQGSMGGAVSDRYFWDDTHTSITSPAGGGGTSLPAGSLTEHRWQNGVAGYRDNNMIDTWKYDTIEISTSSATATCPIEVDLEVSKSQSPAILVPGTNVTYTVDVQNNGVVNVSGASVVDNLDPRLTGVTWACAGASGASCASPSGTGNLNESEDIPVGGKLTYTIAANIPADATGNLSNTAEVQPPGGIPETDATNNTAIVNSSLTAKSDLVISKTHSPLPFVAGSPGQWVITVVNNGPSDAPGILINDAFPAGFSSPTWNCSLTAGTGACSNASGTGDLVNESIDLDVGAAAQFVVSGIIPAGGLAAMINTASLTHPNDTDPANNSAPDNATVDLINDLVVAKTHSPEIFVPGAAASYLITVSNAGPSNATGITFNDSIPPELLSATWTCALSTGTGSCSTASGSGDIAITIDLDVGATATVTINGTVDPNATTAINNSSAVSHPDDDDPGNNTDNTVANVDPQVNLLVTKMLVSPNAVAGQAISYEVIVTNNGPSYASAVDVADPLPSSILNPLWTCLVSSGTGNCGNTSGSGSISETVDLAPGSSITYTINGTLDPSACGTLSNTATVSSKEETDESDNKATVDATIIKLADLSVDKSHTPNPAVPGDSLTYTVVVSNAGPASVFGASFIDDLPAELLAATWSCAVTGTGVCSAPNGSGNISETLDLAPGASATFTITGLVEQHTTANFSNSASIAPPPGITDPNDSNDSAKDEAIVDPQVNLSVLKGHTPENPVPGLPFSWTIEVSNNGPSAASNLSFTDNFPVEALNPTWTCTVSGAGSCPAPSGTGDIVAATMNLDANISAEFIVTATLDPNFSGNFTNSASATHPEETDPADNIGTDSAAANVQVDLEVTKSHNPVTFVAGSPANWTFQVKSLGPSNVDDIVVMDSLPLECTSPAWSCNITSGVGNCDAPSGSGSINTTVDLDAGAVAEYSVSCLIDPSFTGSSSNTATISHPDDVFGPNNIAADTVPVIKQGNIGVTKTHSPDPLTAGQSGTFTIEVVNNGPSDLSGISFTDNLPTDLLLPTWSCSITGSGSCSSVSGSGDINETLDLKNGAMATFLVSGTISPSSFGISNSASASHPDDPDGTNNSDTDSSAPEVLVDLVVGKSHSPNPIVAGDPAQFSFQITNNGPSDAVGVAVLDTLPASFAGASWTCSSIVGSGSCANATGSGDIDEIIDVPAGSTIEFVISTTLASSLTGVIENTVSISHPGDISPDNNQANDQAPVDTLTGISIDKSHSPLVFIPGQAVQYSIVVRNSGSSDAVGTTVVDNLPPSIIGASWTCSSIGSAVCGSASGIGNINETVDLPAGTSATYLISGTLNPDETTAVLNSASASHPGDLDTSNDSVEDSANVDVQADVSILKESSPQPAVPGDAINYIVTITNDGPSTAAGIIVNDTLPASLLSPTWTCSTSIGTGLCSSPSGSGDISTTVDVGPNSAIQFQITATVDPLATGDLVNTASFVYLEDSTPGDESSTNISPLDPATNIVSTKIGLGDGFITGESIAYEITVTNNGPSAATGIYVTDPLNSEILNASWTCQVSGPGLCSTSSGLGDVVVFLDLSAGSRATIIITAELSLNARTTVPNTVFVVAPDDPDPADNSKTITTAVMNLMCGAPEIISGNSIPWNGFLNQTNVITLQNTCADEIVDAFISLLDIDGNPVGSPIAVWVYPNSQHDLIVNELEGFQSGSYGNVELNFSAPGCISSSVAYYGLDENGAITQQSSYFGGAALTGPTYASFNTFQPSLSAEDLEAPVYNWLQVRNADPLMSQTFTKNIYNSIGTLLVTETFTVPPLSRRDLEAGHTNPGPSKAGMVEVIPTDPSKEYFAEVVKYGFNGSSDLSFTYASPLVAGSNSVCEWVNISNGAGAANWLTVLNTGVSSLALSVKLVDQSNPSSNTVFYSVEPGGQRGIDATAALAPGSSGYAEICTSNGGSFTAESTFYYYTADGTIASVLREESRLGRCSMSFSSYNTFLEQDNWLRVVNPGTDAVSIQIDLFDSGGSSAGNTVVNINPGQGMDINLGTAPFTATENSYGTVKVSVLTTNGGFIIGDVLRVTYAADGTIAHAEAYPLD